MTKSRKLLHIGYQKTGTTTLQKQILPKWGTFVGKHGLDEQLMRQACGEIIVGAKPETAIPAGDIVSYEILLIPGNLQEMAARTQAVIPAETCLITIRRQDKLIWSRYLHDIGIKSRDAYGKYSLNDALSTSMKSCIFPVCNISLPLTINPFKCECGVVKSIPLPFYNFKAVRDIYSQFFNVLVLPMEFMVASPQKFADTISDAASLPAIELPQELQRQNPRSTELDHPNLEPLIEYFRESNRALQAHCPVDLQQWGYY